MKQFRRSLLKIILIFWVIGGILAIVFLRPVADLRYLYTYYPETKDSLPADVIGTEIVGFIDPSFYYRFSGSETDAVALAKKLKLETISEINSFSSCFRPTGMLWHDLTWWNPDVANASKLFHAYRDGNEFCLMHDFQNQFIYLYIQNT
jgi:hypothetical protein